MQLLPIMEQVAQLKSIFNLITFHHIYRERNAMADRCLKEVARPLQLAWDIEEHEPNGAFPFYHRPYIEAPHMADV